MHEPSRRDRYQADPRYRWYVLTVLMIGVFSSAFPTTLLSASLPDIAKDLDAPTSVITWVQSAPAIAFAVGMPFFGKIGDLHGHRRAFILGFIGLATSALLTSLAWNAGSLIAFRCIGQMAGAATSTAAFGLIAAVFVREGDGHTVYRNPQTNRSSIVPVTTKSMILLPQIFASN